MITTKKKKKKKKKTAETIAVETNTRISEDSKQPYLCGLVW